MQYWSIGLFCGCFCFPSFLVWVINMFNFEDKNLFFQFQWFQDDLPCPCVSVFLLLEEFLMIVDRGSELLKL